VERFFAIPIKHGDTDDGYRDNAAPPIHDPPTTARNPHSRYTQIATTFLPDLLFLGEY
jgi:hypothetical protein